MGVFHSAGIKKVLLFILLTCFGVAGIWELATGAGAAWEAAESSGWPTVEGTVLSAEVHRQASAARHGSGASFTPQISYAYTVNGENFTGTTLAPGRMWGTKSSYAAVRMFPKGSHPAVYYSPGDPKESVLVPGLRLANLAKLLAGFVLLVVVVIFAGASLAPAPGRKFLWVPVVVFVIGIGGIIYLSSL